MEKEKIVEIITKILAKYGDELVDDIEKRISKGRRPSIATGKLLDSVRYEVTHANSIISLEVSLEEYAKFINDGRKAGSFPPVDKIREWVKTKGLTMTRKPKGLSREKEVKTLSYLIGRKIFRDGIRKKRIFPTLDVDKVRLEILKALNHYFTVDLYTELQNIASKK